MQTTTTNLTYARNDYIKKGYSHTFDTVGDMLYYILTNNDIACTRTNTLSLGTSSSNVTLSAGTSYLSIYTSCAATTSTHRSQYILQTQTAAATASQVEALRVEIESDVKTGAWANAIMAQIDYKDSGAAHGMAATVCAEMVPPNGSLARGALYALDLEFGCGASSTWGSAGPVAFMKMENWGTAAHFSANAFLFHLAGETGAAGALLGANSNTLKVRIGTTTQYVFLSEYEDTISIGLTGAKKTLVTTVPEIAVWSTSALTSGTQDVVKIDFTQTAAQQSGYIKGIRCTMTSNVKTPGSFNGVKGIIDYSTNGYPHGDCAPVASELIPPNSSATRGTFSCFEAQVVPGASSAWNSAGPLSFFRCKVGGTVTHFDSYGYLFTIEGCNSGSTNFWYDATNGTTDEWIKVKTPSGDRYLMLSDTATEA